ncbi:hypothetical protein CVV38_00580 [Candidatus Peregrinibacteria bacterium HGW-Peregrinibacteria-1]|jgi:predicted alpha/beta hydrolase family esterase|nr:MAG: hypothetical protein CVV38_00580 [Candidatus Peregrinibacteria bacterium HGW-Peregrinibacteria-1]
MKKILGIHGFMGNEKVYFFPWIKSRYQNHAEIHIPSFPNPKTPHIHEWTETIKELPENDFDLIIAHSLGGTFALSLIMRDIIKTKHLITIGSSPGPKETSDMSTFLNYPLEFPKIMPKIESYTIVHSFDDPYTYPEYAITSLKHSKGTGIFYADQGHFETLQLPKEVTTIIDQIIFA